MTTGTALLYRDGRRIEEVPFDQAVEWRPKETEFLWMEVQAPSDRDLRLLGERLSLHPLAVEDASKEQQSPKLDVYGDSLFMVVHTAAFEGDRIAYGQVSIFVSRGRVLVIQNGPSVRFDVLRSRIERSPDLVRRDVGHVLHGILDFVVDGHEPLIDEIGEEVLALEERVLVKPLVRDEVASIFRLRRELTRFQREFAPMSDVLGKLANLDLPCVAHDTRPYFKDVQDRARRTDLTVGGLRDVITSLFDLSSLLEQRRQGEISRKLAAWAAIVAVPTAITGIYGMNFDVMPELGWAYGYPFVLLLITVACLTLVWRFKRSGWL